jgi:hypothetical protein
VAADFNIARAQFAWHDADALPGGRISDPEQGVGEVFAKPAVEFAEIVRVGDGAAKTAGIDPVLDSDMGFRLKLEIALARVVAVVVLECPLDIDGVRIVSFDEIAVVAIHRANEIGKGGYETRGQAPAEASRLLGKFNGPDRSGGHGDAIPRR